MTRYLLSLVLILTLYATGNAQDEQSSPPNDEDMFDLSLEELMSIPIVSASKKAESSFEAPVTSFVITRQDILNSGSTSIPEALRLAPGLIVREIANGSYDVSIRGGKDNLPPNQFTYLNTSILAMIDNRPVFNYFLGGTYWQNLPIDMADIERIEIVYGPNAPLYGPNAVDGVINIITRKDGGQNTYGSANIQMGENNVFSALVGTKVSDRLSLNLSANNTLRKRKDVEFFDSQNNVFITDLTTHSNDDLASNPYLYFPDPEVSSKRTGVNFNLFFTPKEKTTFTLNSGYNESTVMSGFTAGSTVNQMSNSSLHHLLKAETGNFTFQTSILRGHQKLVGNLTEYNYDYYTFDSYLDYNLKVNDQLSFRPAFSYQNANIDDREYTVDIGRTGLFNNKATMYNYSFSLKADYNPIRFLRIIGAVRADKFKAPDDTYLSYQGIANYKINDRNIIRFLAGRSFAGSFINQAYSDYTISDSPFLKIVSLGNENINLLQNNILELGYKTQIGKRVSVDVTVYQQTYTDLSAQLTTVTKEPVFGPMPEKGEFSLIYQNLDLKARQRGATVSATMVLGNISLKPFITYQETQLTNYSPYNNEAHPFFYPEYNIDATTDEKSKFAPNMFGGFAFNAFVKKWNFNVTGYYYGDYVLNGLSSVNQSSGALIERDIENIESKLLINANVSYKVSSKFTAFVNARNITAQTAREAYGSDKIGALLFAGFNIEL